MVHQADIRSSRSAWLVPRQGLSSTPSPKAGEVIRRPKVRSSAKVCGSSKKRKSYAKRSLAAPPTLTEASSLPPKRRSPQSANRAPSENALGIEPVRSTPHCLRDGNSHWQPTLDIPPPTPLFSNWNCPPYRTVAFMVRVPARDRLAGFTFWPAPVARYCASSVCRDCPNQPFRSFSRLARDGQPWAGQTHGCPGSAAQVQKLPCTSSMRLVLLNTPQKGIRPPCCAAMVNPLVEIEIDQ